MSESSISQRTALAGSRDVTCSAWVMADKDGLRYVHLSIVHPGGYSVLGRLHHRKCGICNREMTVHGEWYHCIAHGTQGKIRTEEEYENDETTCDPRWRRATREA